MENWKFHEWILRMWKKAQRRAGKSLLGAFTAFLLFLVVGDWRTR
jgi:hypothetical protein